MKKTIKVGGLVLICSSVLVVNNAFSAEEICCSEELSPQQCCESNYGAWCSAKGVCVPYDEYCDYLCPDHARAYNCACANVSIYVSSPKASEQPYCCAKGETLQSCCQALGFTWVGPTANTGKCSAPDPVACFKYISRVYYGESSWGEPSDRCCDTGSEADCCASFGGYWCDINKTCYQDIYLEEFAASPCVTSQICNSISSNGQQRAWWCEGNKKCYTDYLEYQTTCSDIDTAAKCETAYYFYWCASNSKCYAFDSTYWNSCADAPRTRCETMQAHRDQRSGVIYSTAYRYCEHDQQCYDSTQVQFYGQCADIDETYCRNHNEYWCVSDERCWPSRNSYYQSCSDVTDTICTTAGYWWCPTPHQCYTSYSSYGYFCPDATADDCWNSGNYYCSSENKCYSTTSGILSSCSMSESDCKRINNSYRWCSKNSKCYSSQNNYNYGCK